MMVTCPAGRAVMATLGSLLRPSTRPVSELIQVPGVHRAQAACTHRPQVVCLIRPPLTGHSAHAGRLSGPAEQDFADSCRLDVNYTLLAGWAEARY